ncbi:hypothetical protein RSJ22_14245 [Clostridium botulinum]|nr:hypothetical protein RSJ22_14245 [Clostridium botulinum]NFG98640.1 hypothetical protein [Clostridium sporogenes]NFH30950.1 hypothetical protein [Clostridium sporogenes]NFL18531.1 hypothetical protein [Clostridium sporogenes]NFN73408.1 hypothetical protein [Clostridium sporogenes]
MRGCLIMKYYNIEKKYLALSLSYLGFKFYIFDKEDGTKIYSFEDTEKFRMALTELTKLKNKLK